MSGFEWDSPCVHKEYDLMNWRRRTMRTIPGKEVEQVKIHAKMARDYIARGDFDAAQRTLNGGLEHVRTMDDLETLLSAAQSHFELTDRRSIHEAHVSSSSNVGFTIIFTDIYDRGEDVYCHPKQLRRYVKFIHV